MSLDVYLKRPGIQHLLPGPHIFIREDGQTKEITREEWDIRFPDREPHTVELDWEDEVYHANITHNLNSMADEADLYDYLWRPDDLGLTKASELIVPLADGLDRLLSNPEHYEKFNPKNGWGDYYGLVRFVQNYLDACERYPDALIEVSR